MPTRVILDCDTGTDDAVAIMLAGLSEAIDLIAVTTVNGNVPVDVVTENTVRVLELIGRAEVPVLRGAAHAIDRGDFPVPRESLTGFEMHGTYLDLPPASGSAGGAHAVEYLLEAARSAIAEASVFTLIATGPLTNIARCVREFPGFSGAVERLIVMGGGHAIGNVTPSAEFNFWADPEAAREVMGAGFRDLLLVPLDATHQALVTGADCERLRGLGTPAGIASADLIQQRIRGHDAGQPMPVAGAAPVHDALCVAVLLDASVLSTVRVHVDVEVAGALTVGRSVIDLHHRSGSTANAEVAVSADPARFVDLLAEAFAQ